MVVTVTVGGAMEAVLFLDALHREDASIRVHAVFLKSSMSSVTRAHSVVPSLSHSWEVQDTIMMGATSVASPLHGLRRVLPVYVDSSREHQPQHDQT